MKWLIYIFAGAGLLTLGAVNVHQNQTILAQKKLILRLNHDIDAEVRLNQELNSQPCEVNEKRPILYRAKL